MPKFIPYISSADDSLLTDTSLECYLLADSLPLEFIKSFLSKARLADKLCLISGDNALNLCQDLNFDGVLLDFSKSEISSLELKSAKHQLGSKIFGVISRNRRHEAMLISECEPDFVVFKTWKAGEAGCQELVGWYNELFLIQSAIWLQDEDMTISSYSADIVIINDRCYKILVAENKSLD